MVNYIDATYEAMLVAGVEFEMPSEKQPSGWFRALFIGLDGDVFYLDQVIEH